MRITCVIGPYFPVPPVIGGAVERIFSALGEEFARRGHCVTLISRRYEGFANEEVVGGVRHIRIASRDAPVNRLWYRLFDVLYALRACLVLPASDITITHSVFLPLIIPKHRAGKLYVSVARFPKRQMGLYRRADRLQAVSSHVARAIHEQSPSVAPLVKVVPNALSAAFSGAIDRARLPRNKEILFVGRIAREKGIDTLIRAFLLLSEAWPEWRLVIVGPHEQKHGGDGAEFLAGLKQLCEAVASRVEFTGPIFDERRLIDRFEQAEIFVYPSIASLGESFGMAPLEAMACGCAVVTSALECFEDFLLPGENGMRFDHKDATGRSLADSLNELISSPGLRARLADRGVATSRRFTPGEVAGRFLEDFSELTHDRVRDPLRHFQSHPLREFLLRVRRFYRTYGAVTTIKRAIVLGFNLDPYKRTVARYSTQGNERIFSEIYEKNLWQTGESRSGRGSTLAYTRSLREALPGIVSALSVRSLVDAPCGDFNWMRHVELPAGCTYLGLDVVPALIARNQSMHGGEGRQFMLSDITKAPLPTADLVFCRDCLFHLSFADIFLFLRNFANSGSSYLMTSTHKNSDGFPNKDIKSGDFRRLDLFSEPFLLHGDVVLRVDDFVPPDPEREMCVWKREAIIEVLDKAGR